MIRHKIYCKCRREIFLIGLLSFLAGFWITLNWRIEECLNHKTLEESVSFHLGSSFNHDNERLEYPYKVDDTTEYLVIIPSSPHNYHMRKVIRSTWIRLVHNIDVIDGKKIYQWTNNHSNEVKKSFIKLYFVIGVMNLTSNLSNQLKIEYNQYKDLLFLNEFIDSYNKLTQKVLLTMKWCSDSFSNLKYVIKTDDDSFVRIDKIINELEAYGPKMNSQDASKYISSKGINASSNGLLWGHFNGKATVFKKGKWKEKEWFLCDKYLPYPLGGGYVISKSIVDYVARNHKILSQYNSEDVSMGVWTAPLDIHRVHDIRFDTEWISRSCSNYYFITHKHSAENITHMYQNLLASNGQVLCNREYGQKYVNYYGW